MLRHESGFEFKTASGEHIPVKVIRTSRTSTEVRITEEGLTVRAPLLSTNLIIRAFLNGRMKWIETNYAKLKKNAERTEHIRELTESELNALMKTARRAITERVEYYAPIIGVTYGRISIRKQKTRWGSCSPQGNLNFNCLLMLAPPEVMDSVVVHELCHRKEMNHSSRFYALVRKAFTEYDRWHGWLKEHGSELLKRLPKEAE